MAAVVKGEYVSVYEGTPIESRAKVLATKRLDQDRVMAMIEFTSGPYKGEIPETHIFYSLIGANEDPRVDETDIMVKIAQRIQLENKERIKMEGGDAG